MTVRTATATGSIINDGNVDTQFRITLTGRVLDTASTEIASAVDSKDVFAEANGRSSLISLSVSHDLEGGQALEATLGLDRLDPVPQNGIGEVSDRFEEPLVVGGSLDFTFS